MQQSSGGPDIVHYATACADNIQELQNFKVSCKPTFLFIVKGDLVGFVHGADGGKMRDALKEAVDKELKVVEGIESRSLINLEEAVPKQESEELDEAEEDGGGKKKFKSLKNSIMSKKVVSNL